ncbi:FGGY-family carbohydrate kinase [Devriesea agamarum]|uniref:FGGY-family carbohydrate kinase n=1 Tax=Devriesea agamarum TaxID=472569 RepID=UPI00071D358A|nr:FGGY family carbohydrate kinase [Devriesea agamarum]
MRGEAFLGVDIGTGSSKAVLVDPDGSVIGARTVEHRVTHASGGRVEMDMRLWWDEFKALFSQLIAAYPVRVLAIGVSGMGPCVGLTDHADRPLAPAALYGVDTRSGAQIARLRDLLGDERVLATCDSPLTSQAAGPKLMWFQDHAPEEFAAGVRLYMPASWLIRHLTGEYVLDRHSASQCTPLLDAETLTWDNNLVRDLLPGLMLPRLGWARDICGEVTASVAAELPGLQAGTPVLYGTIDAWAEQESVGAVRAGELFLMYGSTMFLIANVPRRVRHPAMWGTAGTQLGMRHLAGGLAASGSITSWFRDLTGGISYAQLVAEAEKSPPGANGLLALPYFAGERSPLHDPDARGVIAGLTTRHVRGDIYRAILESTAFAVRHNLEAMRGAGVEINRITCAGGGTQASLWTAVVTEVTGIPQEVHRYSVGASYGNAFLAARAIGMCACVDEWNPVEHRIEPSCSLNSEARAAFGSLQPGEVRDAHEALVPHGSRDTRGLYEELYGLYRDLHRTTSGLQHRLASLQP